jgi:hypothetical protein
MMRVTFMILMVGEGERPGQKTCDDLQARWQTIQRVEICAKKSCSTQEIHDFG